MRAVLFALIVMASGTHVSSPLLARGRGGRVTCIGGTVAAASSRPGGSVHTTDPQYFLFQAKGLAIRVPYAKINLLEYGQQVGRRYAMAILISPVLLLSKKRKHYLTVGYTDDEGHQQAFVFLVDKGDIRSVLVGLEVKTGLKVAYQDEEARKAGKG